MKSRSQFRLLAVPLLTVMLFGCVPSLDAAVFNSPLLTLIKIIKDRRKEDNDRKKKATVPEGSSGGTLVLAASALGGALLISRRKRSPKAV